MKTDRDRFDTKISKTSKVHVLTKPNKVTKPKA